MIFSKKKSEKKFLALARSLFELGQILFHQPVGLLELFRHGKFQIFPAINKTENLGF